MISAKHKTRCGFVVVPGQRALERGLEVLAGANREGICQNRASNKNITGLA